MHVFQRDLFNRYFEKLGLEALGIFSDVRARWMDIRDVLKNAYMCKK